MMTRVLAILATFTMFGGPWLASVDFHLVGVALGVLLFLAHSSRGVIPGWVGIFVLFSMPALAISAVITVTASTGTWEFEYLWLRTVLYGLAVAGLVAAYQKVYGPLYQQRLVNHLVLVFFVLSASAIFFIVSPWYRETIGTLLYIKELWPGWIESGHRAVGLMGGAFGGAFALLLFLFLTAIAGSKCGIRKTIVVILILVGIVAGTFMARSFVVLGLAGGCFLVFLQLIRSFSLGRYGEMKSAAQIVALVLMIFLSIPLVVSVIPENVSQWAFEFLGDQGELRAPKSLKIILKEMYFLPNDAVTATIGGGYLGRWEGGPYVESDVGYVRLVHEVGILGTSLIVAVMLTLLGVSSWHSVRDGDWPAKVLAVGVFLLIMGNTKELIAFPRNAGVLMILFFALYWQSKRGAQE